MLNSNGTDSRGVGGGTGDGGRGRRKQQHHLVGNLHGGVHQLAVVSAVQGHSDLKSTNQSLPTNQSTN